MSITAFAEYSDLRGVTVTQTLGERLIRYASAQLVLLGFDPDETDEYKLLMAKEAVCNAVGRMVSAENSNLVNVSSMSQSVGDLSASVTLANAGESLYFTRTELGALGLGGSTYRSIGGV